MPGQAPTHIAAIATLLSSAILAAAEFAGAQTASGTYPQEATPLAISLVSPQQMTSADRAAVQSWQVAIAASAQFFGYAVDSSYTYREIACPVAPHHLLLAYEATAPNGAISRFTAVIRRGAEEEIDGSHSVAQIIPILHFGILPFVPAIADPHSIEVFNAAISSAPGATEVLSANEAGNQPLLVRALCYLAMVGEEPAALNPARADSPNADPQAIHAPLPTLVFNKGKIRQIISVRSSRSSYQVWTLTFQPGGHLLAATHQEHPIDRTPLVLNAVNSEPPRVSTGAAKISPSDARRSPEPLTPVSASPSAAITTTAPVPSREPTAPRARPPASTASAMANVDPAPAATPAMTQPSTLPAPVPAMAAPEPDAAVSTPQPSVAPGAPTAKAAPTVTPEPAPQSAAFAERPLVVQRSAPAPPSRFIPHPPPPPSKFIPDSALKTPPHLPQ